MSVNSMSLCKYEIHGGCNKKDTCPFQHRSRVECYHQDRPGGCAKGADCLYMHHPESITPDVTATTISKETPTNLNDVEDVQKLSSPSTQNIIIEQMKTPGLSSKSTTLAPNTKSMGSPSHKSSPAISLAGSKRAISPPTNNQVTSLLSSKSNQPSEERLAEIVLSAKNAGTDARLNYGIRPFAEIMAEKKAKKAAEEAASPSSQQNISTDRNNTNDKSTPSQVKNPIIRQGLYHNGMKLAIGALQNSVPNENHNFSQSQSKSQSQQGTKTPAAPQKRSATAASVSMPTLPKKQKIDRSNFANPAETIEAKPEITVNNITTAAKRARSQEIEQDLNDSPNGIKRAKVNGISLHADSSSARASDSVASNTNEKGSVVASSNADEIDDLDEFTEEDLEGLGAISPEDLVDFDLDAAERELGFKS